AARRGPGGGRAGWRGWVPAGPSRSRYTSARRRASSRSVLRLRCLNFQAALVVLATRQVTPRSAHRSWTQPASRQASMSTTVGWGRARRRVISWRLVGKEGKGWAPAEGYRQPEA